MPEDITRLLERSTPDRFDEPDFDALIRKGRRRRITHRAVLATVVVAVLALAIALMPLSGGPAPVVEDIPDPVGTWQSLPEGPLSPRIDVATLTTDDGRVVVWGGTSPREQDPGPPFGPVLVDGAVFDPATGSWTAIPDAPLEVQRHGWDVRLAGDELAVVADGNGSAMQAAIYDLQAQQWQLLDPPPLDTRMAEVFAWDGQRLVLWGGRTGIDTFYRGGAIYDTSSQTWTEMADPPLDTRVGVAWVWTDQQLIVWGGEAALESEVFDDGAIYDPASDTWEATAPSPLAARSRAAATWTGEHMVVIGGSDPTQEDSGTEDGPTARRCPDDDCDGEAELGIAYDPHAPGIFYDGARYDPDTDTWTQIPSPPQDAAGSAFPIMPTRDAIGIGVREDHNPAHVYRPSQDQWESIQIPGARTRLQLFDADGQLAAVTNPWLPPTTQAPFELWVPLSDGRWAPAPAPPEPTDRRGLPAVAYTEHGLFMWGGAEFDPDQRLGIPESYRTDGWIWKPTR